MNVLFLLNEVLPAGASVKLDMTKLGLIPIPIPCVTFGDISLGSWYVIFNQI